jgi:hypothetical protein
VRRTSRPGEGKPIEALSALERVLACAVRPRLVIISFDPGHFSKPDTLWDRSVRFAFVTNQDISDLREASALIDDPSVHGSHHFKLMPTGS